MGKRCWIDDEKIENPREPGEFFTKYYWCTRPGNEPGECDMAAESGYQPKFYCKNCIHLEVTFEDE